MNNTNKIVRPLSAILIPDLLESKDDFDFGKCLFHFPEFFENRFNLLLF